MKSTALGAENIIFISDAHEKFYYEKLQEVRYQDVYHKATLTHTLTLPTLPRLSSTSLSAGLKCMNATRKGQNRLFSISGYTLTISADLKMN